MDLQEIKVFLSGPLAEVDAMLEESLRSDIALLYATNRSLLLQGGKRMRPALSLLSAGACGGINPDSIRFAAASELIHNSTLLHDDVVDGATLRRGRPTVMSILSGPASVLLGDFWLVKAVRCILDASRESERVIRLFAKTLSDLAEGELLQMQKASSADTTRDDYLRIIYSKTASLFEASVLSGAVSAGAPEEWTAALAGYARNLGLAFQIKDDIFDYAGGDSLGKPVGIDLREQKITLPLLCALDSVPTEEAAEVRSKVRRIVDAPESAEPVRDFVLTHGGVEGAASEMEKYIDTAIFCLEELPSSTEKSYLAQLARYVGERAY
ncbi:MAG: polyprenyl synthetase family protein [Bacteroidales bacterium]|nr:polyprenyl synthetase family protein [Bacteroidales bacterium]